MGLRRSTVAAWLLAAAVALAACGGDSSEDAAPAAPEGAGTEEDAGEAQEGAAVATDVGDFVVTHLGAEDPALAALAATIEESAAFEPYLESLNEVFALPADIGIEFTECGEQNAFYDPERVTVQMCYELLAVFVDSLGTGEDAEADVLNAGLFTLFHEVGHALVDQLSLPFTGREEDAADELATMLLLLDFGDLDAAIAGVEQFALGAEDQVLDELAFADTHSLDAQRLFDTLCLIYGSDPDAHGDLVGGDGLPPDRAEICAAEFDVKASNWDALLAPHVKG